jgi:hypothetical protein
MENKFYCRGKQIRLSGELQTVVFTSIQDVNLFFNYFLKRDMNKKTFNKVNKIHILLMYLKIHHVKGNSFKFDSFYGLLAHQSFLRQFLRINVFEKSDKYYF